LVAQSMDVIIIVSLVLLGELSGCWSAVTAV